MLIENSNLDVRILVLARPADSVGVMLASALQQWQYAFSVYSTVYELIDAAKDIPEGQPAVLIVRPAMLGPQAAVFIERFFPDLRIIAWVDFCETMSDRAIVQTMADGMMTASGLDQLQQIIHRRYKNSKPPVPDIPEELDRLAYKLSEDEVTALLGVEK